MAISIGQPGSLKNILSKIEDQGFSHINSLEDINDFLKNYESKKSEIYTITENKIGLELNTLKADIDRHRIVLNDNYRIKKKTLIHRINNLVAKKDRLHNLVLKTKLARFIVKFRLAITGFRIHHLKRSSIKRIHKATKPLKKKIFLFEVKYNDLSKNKNRVIERRAAQEIKELDKIKTFLDNERSLISGAYGEVLVSKELEKLSDEFIILHDFNAQFNPPVFIKKTNDRVLSIQIDHVVLSKAGIFLVETKNWSRESVNSIDLRSPVEQIVRNGSAMFFKIQDAINDNKIHLKKNHWGQKKIPIRNLIVMINNKPQEDFQFVKIKLLKELNSYLEYFDQVLSYEELESIKNWLLELKK
ncbi:MAG: nuclease-related domain-containing protein [Bacteroidales bacterium]